MDYKNGKCYVIRNHVNDQVYVGSTTQSLSKRFSKHGEQMDTKTKSHIKFYQALKEYGKHLFYIELLENYPCESKEQLHAREGYYIRQFDSFKNGYNSRIEGRDNKTYLKDNKEKVKMYRVDYYRKNKEKVDLAKKANYEKNKNKINQRGQEYYEKNKIEIIQKAKERTKNSPLYTCLCGTELKMINKRTHNKTKKHTEALNNSNTNI